MPQDIEFWMIAGCLVLALVVFAIGMVIESSRSLPAGPPPLPPSPGLGGWRVGDRIYRPYDLVVIAGLIFLYASPLAIRAAGMMPEETPEIGPAALIQTMVMQFILMGGVIGVVAWRKSPVEWLGLRWRWWLMVLVIAPVGVVTTWVFAIGVDLSGLNDWLTGTGGAAEKQEVVEAFGEAGDGLTLFLLCLTAVVVAPVTEEVIFRGYLYPVARRFAGRWPGIVFSALIFAMVHHSAIALLPLCFLAILLALSYEWTGSIWAPLSIHFLFNGATVAAQIAMRMEWIALPET